MISRLPTLRTSSPSVISSYTVLAVVEAVARLVDVREVDGGADHERAVVGSVGLVPRAGPVRRGLDDHAEQRRLARSVGTDHPDDPGAGEREREVLDEQSVAERLDEPGRLDDLVAEARPGGDGDLELRRGVPGGLGVGLELFVGLAAAPSTWRDGPWAPSGPIRARVRGCDAGPGSASPPGPAAAASVRATPSSCPRTAWPLPRSSSRIHWATLSRKYRSWVMATTVPGVVLEEPLEPGHRLGVEVVGRLVEQEQVGSSQQQPAQRHAATFATRQVRHRRRRRREVGARPSRCRWCVGGPTRRPPRSSPRARPVGRRASRSRRRDRPTSP